MPVIRKRVRRALRELWDGSIEDRVASELIARRHYELLFVEQGTVIKAPRDCAPPNLEEILAKNGRLLELDLAPPPRGEGGMGKFARDVLNKQPRMRRTRARPNYDETWRSGPPKHGGRGWLHRRQRR